MDKKVQMKRAVYEDGKFSHMENVVPVVDSKHVLMSDGKTLHETVNDLDTNYISDEIFTSSPNSKIGKGDTIDKSSTVKAGLLEDVKLYGNTMVNYAKDHGTSPMLTVHNKKYFKVTEGLDDTIIPAAGKFDNFVLKGNTLENIVPDYPCYTDDITVTDTDNFLVNNNPSVKMNNEIVKKWEIYGDTALNIIPEKTCGTDLVTIKNKSYAPLLDGDLGTVITDVAPLEEITFGGRTLVNLLTGYTGMQSINGSNVDVIKYDLVYFNNTSYMLVYDLLSTEGIDNLCFKLCKNDGRQVIDVHQSVNVGLNKIILPNIPLSANPRTDKLQLWVYSNDTSNVIEFGNVMLIAYQTGIENWDTPYFTGLKSVELSKVISRGRNILKPLSEDNNGLLFLDSGNDTGTVAYDESNNGYYVTSHRLLTTSGLRPNTTYTLSMSAKKRTNGIYGLQVVIDGSSNEETISLTTESADYETISVCFTTPNNLSDFSIKFYDGIYFKQLQLEEGNSANSYEDYTEDIIEFTDPNLLMDSSYFKQGNLIFNKDASFDSLFQESTSHICSKNLLPLEKNTKYMMNTNPLYTVSAYIYEDNILKQEFTGNNITFTTNSKNNSISFVLKSINDEDITPTNFYDVELKIRTTLKIRSLDNGRMDELDLKRGELKVNVGEVILDGSENWMINHPGSVGVSFHGQVDNFISEGVTYNEKQIACDRIRCVYGHDWTSNRQININAGNLNIRIEKTELPTGLGNYRDASELKEWLSKNPVTFQYELTDPYVKNISNHILVNGEVKVGKRMPDGTQDGYNPSNGLYTKRIKKGLLHDLDWEISNLAVSNRSASFHTTYFDDCYDERLAVDGLPKGINISCGSDNNTFEGISLSDSTETEKLKFRISYSRIPWNESRTSAFKWWLSQNIISVYAKLRTEEVNKVEYGEFINSLTVPKDKNNAPVFNPKGYLEYITHGINASTFKVSLHTRNMYVLNHIEPSKTYNTFDVKYIDVDGVKYYPNENGQLTTPDVIRSNKIVVKSNSSDVYYYDNPVITEYSDVSKLTNKRGISNVDSPILRVNHDGNLVHLLKSNMLYCDIPAASFSISNVNGCNINGNGTFLKNKYVSFKLNGMEPNTTYNFYTSKSANTNYICVYDAFENKILAKIQATGDVSFVSPNHAHMDQMELRIYNIEGDAVWFSSIQLIKGNNVSFQYYMEPMNAQPFRKSYNLIDINSITNSNVIQNNNDGSIMVLSNEQDTISTDALVHLESGKKYTLKYNADSLLQISLFNENSNTRYTTTTNQNYFTFTVDNTGDYVLQFITNNNTHVTIYDLMLNEGSYSIPYESYGMKNVDLRKVDTSIDHLDFTKGLITRNTGRIIIDETIHIDVIETNQNLTKYGFRLELNQKENSTVICNMVTSSLDSLNIERAYFGMDNLFYLILDNTKYNVTDIHKWLKENPIEVVYQLNNPISEKIYVMVNGEFKLGNMLPNGISDGYDPITKVKTKRLSKIVVDPDSFRYVNFTRKSNTVEANMSSLRTISGSGAPHLNFSYKETNFLNYNTRSSQYNYRPSYGNNLNGTVINTDAVFVNLNKHQENGIDSNNDFKRFLKKRNIKSEYQLLDYTTENDVNMYSVLNGEVSSNITTSVTTKNAEIYSSELNISKSTYSFYTSNVFETPKLKPNTTYNTFGLFNGAVYYIDGIRYTRNKFTTPENIISKKIIINTSSGCRTTIAETDAALNGPLTNKIASVRNPLFSIHNRNICSLNKYVTQNTTVSIDDDGVITLQPTSTTGDAYISFGPYNFGYSPSSNNGGTSYYTIVKDVLEGKPKNFQIKNVTGAPAVINSNNKFAINREVGTEEYNVIIHLNNSSIDNVVKLKFAIYYGQDGMDLTLDTHKEVSSFKGYKTPFRVTPNKDIDSRGREITSSTSCVSDFINVHPFTKLSFHNASGKVPVNVHCYGSNKVFIESCNISPSSYIDGYTYVTGPNVKYIRITKNNDNNNEGLYVEHHLSLRSIKEENAYDELDLIRGRYAQYVGEVDLRDVINTYPIDIITDNGKKYFSIAGDFSTVYNVKNCGEFGRVKTSIPELVSEPGLDSYSIYTTNSKLCIKLSGEEETVDDLKQWLNKRNQLTVQYQLSNPIISYFDKVLLSTNDDSFIQFDTDNEMSCVYPTVEYKMCSSNYYEMINDTKISLDGVAYAFCDDDEASYEWVTDANGSMAAKFNKPVSNVMILDQDQKVPYFKGLNYVKDPKILASNGNSTNGITIKGLNLLSRLNEANYKTDKMDTIDLETGLVVRNNILITINGSNDPNILSIHFFPPGNVVDSNGIIKDPNSNYRMFRLSYNSNAGPNAAGGWTEYCMSNRFLGSTLTKCYKENYNRVMGSITENNIDICLPSDKYVTVEDFKKWLDEEPLYVVGKNARPTTDTINVNGRVISYDDGQLLLSSKTPVYPRASYKAYTSKTGQMIMAQELINEQENEINSLLEYLNNIER